MRDEKLEECHFSLTRELKRDIVSLSLTPLWCYNPSLKRTPLVPPAGPGLSLELRGSVAELVSPRSRCTSRNGWSGFVCRCGCALETLQHTVFSCP